MGEKRHEIIDRKGEDVNSTLTSYSADGDSSGTINRLGLLGLLNVDAESSGSKRRAKQKDSPRAKSITNSKSKISDCITKKLVE